MRRFRHDPHDHRWLPLAWLAGSALVLGPLAAHADTLGLSFETTVAGTQASGPTPGNASPVVTGAATLVPNSGASTYYYGDTFHAVSPIISGSVTSSNPQGFGFVDDYGFTVSTSSADSVTTTIDFGNVLQISNLQVRLFGTSAYDLFALGGTPTYSAIAGQHDGVMATTTVNGATIVTDAIAPASLAAGTYVLEISGIASGSSGGSYSGTLNVTPVPLPAALPLMLSGLGFLGTALRRRAAAV